MADSGATGGSGFEIYQETFIEALAKHFDAMLLVVDSLLLPGVPSKDPEFQKDATEIHQWLHPKAILLEKGKVCGSSSATTIVTKVSLLNVIIVMLFSWHQTLLRNFVFPSELYYCIEDCGCVIRMFVFYVVWEEILGKEEMCYIEELKQCYLTMEKGYNSMLVHIYSLCFVIYFTKRNMEGGAAHFSRKLASPLWISIVPKLFSSQSKHILLGKSDKLLLVWFAFTIY
ncbi:hypothetical protein GUJ93_ZPchr0006g43800 [Zizania palustris]|uniref:Uncharacterized protein n=1 Tax=Zizania palustris TaxID=103762 RepID=A0A8J5TAY2_ZIZPA|nr:hypothetical protein GUJ93_ZPchr0006g43800 [Zizania palustris]